MPDNSSVANNEFWQKILSGAGFIIGAVAGGWEFMRARASKRKKTPAPVGWEEMIMELRRDLSDQIFNSVRVANEAREDTRRLRESDLHLVNRRLERVENRMAEDRAETMSILERIVNDFQLLKRKWLSVPAPSPSTTTGPTPQSE